jgi:hypothetical protein
VNEEELPFSPDITTIDQFNTPRPLLQSILDKMYQWVLAWSLGHEWVFPQGTTVEEKYSALKDALTKGPVCLSVYGWVNDGENYIRPDGVNDNHWTQLARFDGENPIIYDSYSPYEKKLSPDFNFTIAKVYYLKHADPKLSIIFQILQKIAEVLKLDALIIKKQQEAPFVPPQPIVPIPDPIAPTTPPAKPMLEISQEMVRRVCKEEGLTADMSERLYNTVDQESEFSTSAIHHNKDGTTDYGIAQLNSKWYIGPTQYIKTKEEALNNPEKCIHLMCKAFKQGRQRDWYGYRKLYG